MELKDLGKVEAEMFKVLLKLSYRQYWLHLKFLECPFYGVFLAVSRHAFELAKTAPGPIFGSKGEFDVEKIKQSKHFRALLHQSNGKGVKEMVMTL